MASNREKLIREARHQRMLHGKLAKKALKYFATFVHEYKLEWFHKMVYDYLDLWIKNDIKKLAIFMPPQHAKSTMSSITAPAKILGENPKAKVVVASYSDSLASRFNRACQDIIETPEYASIYPGTILPAKGIEITNELRNNKYFEIVKEKGFFKAVSIGGALTGDPIDYGIIDDPIKDRKQANSVSYRENLWNWYNDVFKTRLHNDSSQLMLFTRWHEDDLAGRLFNPKNEHYDEKEASEWTIICLQALKEDKMPIIGALDFDDPRELGEALWPEKHSKEKFIDRKRTNPTSFASLDQQRPAPMEGNKIKREWFNIINQSELPFNMGTRGIDFFIDGAFTDKTENDESAQLSCTFFKGNLYIYNCHGVRKELNEYLKYIVPWLKSAGYTGKSTVNIEMKASGYGFYSMLRSAEYGNHNCLKINSKVVAYGKMERVENIQPTLASGKVYLVKGSWIQEFLNQCASFPNDTHDDMVDTLAYAVHKYFLQNRDVFVTYS